MLTTTTLTSLQLGTACFVLLSFVALMWVLKMVAYRPLMAVLDERANKINNDIDGAEQSRQQAEELVVARQNALQETRQQASQVVSDAKAAARKQSDSVIAAANAQAQSVGRQAQADAVKMKQDAVTQAKQDVAELSVMIASKLMQKNVTLADQQALVDAYIADLDKQD